MSGRMGRSERVTRSLGRAGLATAGLLGAELTLARLSRNELFADGDAPRYALAAFGVIAVASLLGTALLALLRGSAARGAVDASSAGRRLAVAVFLVVAPVSDLVLWRLTSGRWAHTLPGRWLVVALLAGLVALATALAASRWLAWRRSGSRRSRALAALVLVVVAVGCLAVDQRVLQGNYAAFHWAHAALAVLAACVAGDLVPLDGARLRLPARGLAALVVAGVLVSAPALWALRVSSNARYAAERLAPLTGKAVAALRRATPRRLPRSTAPTAPERLTGAAAPDAAAAVASDAALADAGEPRALALTDQSVLLVTVDALRADRLGAYGGHGLTPTLDALARESVVFRRTYTPTPHTSHALGSLFTGTYLHAVLTLPSGGAARPTIASLLRQAGFQTVAFYPPAVFFVDAEQLGALRAGGFGFEHRTVGWATAPERAQQVAQWLARRPATDPVFVWAHVFEPHEPYEPPPAFARGESMIERYDGEVAAADAGIGEIVRAFRAQRPSGTVIVTADHGEEFGEHGAHYHGTNLYDEQARVPLLWSSPGATTPHHVDAPVELVDVATTLLAALGVPPDARMRGDDLGELLRGDDAPAPSYAFASVADEWMVSDGRCKAICAEGEADCRLYDLVADPGERHNVADARPADVTRLREALIVLLASIPRVEAGDDVREPLARAHLGDPTAGPAVLPLLGSPDAALRAEAAAALADLRFAPSLRSLTRLRRTDPEPAVRDEAAIAAFVLGEAAARTEVTHLATQTLECTSPDGGCPDARTLDRARRAALALAASGDGAGGAVLLTLAGDASARSAQRIAAIGALGRLRVRGARAVLEPLLADLVLRTVAAEALGALGDRRAGDALARALSQESYLSARVAEALALVRLRDRRAVTLIRAQLGAAQPLPDGVALLLQAGDLARPSARGADVRRSATVRRGDWRCSVAVTAAPADEGGCVPSEGARLALPRASGSAAAQRVVVRAIVREDVFGPGERRAATLAVGADARPTTLPAGVNEVAFDVDAAQLGSLPVAVTGDVRIVAVAVVARAPVAPPAP